MNRTEQHIKSLEAFKDWSNYLLVTTVASLGWVAEKKPPGHHTFEIWCFAISICFGISTLGLIPIIAAQINDDTESFYDVWPKFKLLFWGKGKQFSVPIKPFCFSQHILFLAGIIGYAIESVHAS